MTAERPADLVLTTDQNWAARSHRELYDAVHQNNDPGKSGEIGWHWEQFGAGLNESAQIIDKELTATEHGWTGASADAARAAIRLLAQWVTQTAHNATELGARVQEQSRIVEAARAAMPEPAEFDWDAATGTLSGPGIASFAASAADVRAANDKARAGHEQAVAVMTEMERQSRAVDEATPHFTAPFNPTTGRVEQPQVTTPTATGAESLRAAVTPEQATPQSGEAPPPAQLGSSPPPRESVEQMLTASASMQSGHLGSMPTGPAEQTSHQNQHSPGHAGTVAAAAAAAGVGVGAYARRGGGRPSDESTTQAAPGVPGETDAFPMTAGAEPTLGASQRSTGQPPSKMPGGPPQGFGAAGGKAPAAPAARGGGGRGGGFSGGMPATPGMPGMPKGKPQDTDIRLAPGRAAGMTDFEDGPESAGSYGSNTSGAVGKSTTDAGGTPMGGAPPPGAGRSAGDEDTERKTLYVQSEDIFGAPGEDLPPSVIGGRKSPKKGGDA